MMEFISILGVIIVTILIVVWLFSSSCKRGNLPPGPWAPPIVGHLRMMKGESTVKLFDRMRKKYGDVFTLYLGSKPLVVVNSFKLYKEVFVKNQEHTYYRPTGLYAVNKLTQEKGVALLGAERQPMLRKWAIQAMSSTEKDKPAIGDIVQEEVGYFCRELSFQEGTPFDVKKATLQAVVNCVNTLMFGDRSEYDDEKFQSFLKYMQSFMEKSAYVFPDNFITWLHHITTDKKLEDRCRQEQELLGKLRERIKEQERTYDAKKVRGFVDLYIQQKGTGCVSEDDFPRMVMELYMAGTETTMTAIRWGIIFMLRNPLVQEKARKEILQEIGDSRLPSIDDIEKLPYTHAAVNEALRIGNPTSTSQFHMANGDFSVAGYNIPAGTLLLGNLYRVHTDEESWEDPHVYLPERWLQNGRVIRKEDFIPFGLGPRDCIGCKLAWAEIFMILAALLQKFNLKCPDEKNPPTLDAVQGLTRSPVAFEVIATPLD